MLKIRRKIMRKIIVKRGRQSKKGGSVTRPTSHRLTFPQLFCQNHPKAKSLLCATHFRFVFLRKLIWVEDRLRIPQISCCFFFKKILSNTDWLLIYDWQSNTHIAHRNDDCGHIIPWTSATWDKKYDNGYRLGYKKKRRGVNNFW